MKEKDLEDFTVKSKNRDTINHVDPVGMIATI